MGTPPTRRSDRQRRHEKIEREDPPLLHELVQNRLLLPGRGFTGDRDELVEQRVVDGIDLACSPGNRR
jgi:hypothetical protein